jgi:cytosine/adenosine deaminase-related metal-dependent hydrolase
LCLGSDQNVVVDLLEEARALEMNERLTALARWRFTPSELVGAMVGGHQALGWPNAGRIAAGAWCDLVGIRLDTVRTAGTELAQAPLAATSADVSDVIASGRHVVSAGRHLLGDVGSLVAESIEALA